MREGQVRADCSVLTLSVYSSFVLWMGLQRKGVKRTALKSLKGRRRRRRRRRGSCFGRRDGAQGPQQLLSAAAAERKVTLVTHLKIGHVLHLHSKPHLQFKKPSPIGYEGAPALEWGPAAPPTSPLPFQEIQSTL